MADMPDIQQIAGGFDFARLAESWSMPLMVLDRELRYVYANTAYLKVLEQPWEAMDGRSIFELFPVPPDVQARYAETFNRTLAGEVTKLKPQRQELHLPDGTVAIRTWQCVQEPYRNERGEVTHLVQRSVDVTAETELRRKNDIIQDELDHRIKNLFSVIIATARISGPLASDSGSFVKDFTRRLEAMSRVYSRLSNNDWFGLSLHSLFVEELDSLLGKNSGRYTLSGDDVTLSVKSTKDAALIIHELAVNALKYGCFSRPGGQLHVTWSVHDGWLDASWTETGISGVRLPERDGFGTALFQMMPNMEITRSFRDEGLHMTLKCPVDISFSAGESA